MGLKISSGKKEMWKRRTSTLSKYVGIQLLVQSLSLLAGFLLVRSFSQREYAFFTIAGAMQGTIGAMSEAGVGSALMSIGGRVWQDKSRFGELIQTSLAYRKRLMLIATLIVTPLLIWTLDRGGSSIFNTLLLCLVVIWSANFQLTNGVLDFTLKINTRLDLLQKAECFGALLRTFFTILICMSFRSALLALTATLCSLILQNWMFKRYANHYADLTAPVNDQDRLDIAQAVKRVSPTTIFYCFQGQITLFLISIFGSVSNVAALGALGRLGVMFLIVNTLVSNVFLPRFARCQDGKALKAMYLQILIIFIVFAAVILSLTTLMPQAFLWLIGKEYSHLSSELPYAMASAIVSSIGAVVFGLNFSRGWMRFAWTSVPIVLVTQILMLPFLHLSSLTDVLLLSIVPGIMGCFPYLIEAMFMFKGPDAIVSNLGCL